MEDSNKHINQKPDGDYPKPDVPVGDAWAEMKDMLDMEMPVDSPSTAVNTSWIKALKLILPLITAAGAVYLFFELNDKNKFQKTAEMPFNKQNSERKLNPAENDFEKPIAKKENSDKDITNLTKGSDAHKSSLPELESKSLPTFESKKESSHRSNSNHSRSVSDYRNMTKSEKAENKSRNLVSENSIPLKVNPGNLTVRTRDRNLNDKAANKGNLSRNPALSPNLAGNNMPKQQKKEVEETDRNSVVSSRQNVGSNLVKNGNDAFSVTSEADKNTSILKMTHFRILTKRVYSDKTPLKQNFKSIPIKAQFLKPSNPTDQKQNTKALLNSLHIGLQWNTNLPSKDYGRFFTGTTQSNTFYTLLIPGIWIGKNLNNGSMLMLKVNPYNQYFGNNQKIDSSSTIKSDTSGNVTKNIHHLNLSKTSGMSAGLQYVHPFTSKWSVGMGAQIYWQNKALLNAQTINSRDGKVLSDSLIRIGKTSENWKLLQPYFIAGNIEVLYSWQKLQFGAGLIIPVTSMTNAPENKNRPINGQLLIRWKIK